MEPSKEEAAGLATFREALEWAGCSEDTQAAIHRALQTTGLESVRTIGLISEGDYAGFLNGARHAATAAGEEGPPLRPLERAAAAAARRACQTAADLARAPAADGAAAGQGSPDPAVLEAVEAARDAAKAAAAAATAGTSAGARAEDGGVELSLVTSQVSKVVVAPLAGTRVGKFHETVGKQALPAGLELSSAQLTGLAHLIDSGSPVYLDFGVWGPHHQRLMRKYHFSAMMPTGPQGAWKLTELYGPPNFKLWEESYRMQAIGFLGFGVMGWGTAEAYRDKIRHYDETYGAAAWQVIYQADVRFRLEHVAVVKRLLEQGAADAQETGQAPARRYDPGQPWEWAYHHGLKDFEFWHMEVEIKCASLAGGHLRGEGDAPVGPGGAGRPAPAPEPPERTGAKRSREPAARRHSVEDGHYTHNRSGKKLCQDFNRGQCTPGFWCPHRWDAVHQCSKCLSDSHGAHTDCGGVPKEPAAGMVGKGGGKAGGKGGGKGRGLRGKGGTGGRPQY